MNNHIHPIFAGILGSIAPAPFRFKVSECRRIWGFSRGETSRKEFRCNRCSAVFSERELIEENKGHRCDVDFCPSCGVADDYSCNSEFPITFTTIKRHSAPVGSRIKRIVRWRM